MDTAERDLTVPEAASRLGVSPSTVRAMFKAGQIWGYRLSGSVQSHLRFPVAEVERLLALRTPPPAGGSGQFAAAEAP